MWSRLKGLKLSVKVLGGFLMSHGVRTVLRCSRCMPSPQCLSGRSCFCPALFLHGWRRGLSHRSTARRLDGGRFVLRIRLLAAQLFLLPKLKFKLQRAKTPPRATPTWNKNVLMLCDYLGLVAIVLFRMILIQLIAK